ncbi:winged helix-turn-helix domain-containing protein [Anaerocolumna sp. MB42-C2]|uniref:winged helix-turn-helix domain-containing protein n=1 Tax=Anaerocolumna sp. MB42-C2 TaxID=3070997 RepID=UPI0027E140C4|nr:helix-turn-helix domain-containing protein [Anaerocolumna sp. MB42-C2]WMJ89311.1 helix-turn-helix domain-containing protein [Anaerocolumna sp. MB42-C2]
MNKVKLTTKKELSIYMNPVRQQLLRQLNITGIPMTPKMLADKLNISASGVQHHIKKLISLGLIELDHTEIINGITASFYKPTYVTVQIGLEKSDETAPQREALTQNLIAQVYDGFQSTKEKLLKKYENADSEFLNQWGDIVTGVLYLKEEESKELLSMISEYIRLHAIPDADRTPWEYAIILYNAKENLDD